MSNENDKVWDADDPLEAIREIITSEKHWVVFWLGSSDSLIADGLYRLWRSKPDVQAEWTGVSTNIVHVACIPRSHFKAEDVLSELTPADVSESARDRVAENLQATGAAGVGSAPGICAEVTRRVFWLTGILGMVAELPFASGRLNGKATTSDRRGL